MKSHASIRAALALAMSLASGIVIEAQTKWPTAKAARTVAAPKARALQIRKAKPSKRRATARTTAATTPTELLRSMSELVTRQAAAIDVLARRLEAAESRLEQLAAAAPEAPAAAERAALDEAQAPFRAALAIDWSEVIGR
jgi:hypothetical protein